MKKSILLLTSSIALAFTGADEFGEAFPRFGLRTRTRIFQFNDDYDIDISDSYKAYWPWRLHIVGNIGLTSIASKSTDPGAADQSTEAGKALGDSFGPISVEAVN